MATATKRKSAEERREAVLDAALVEFAEHGLHGGSTEAIAVGRDLAALRVSAVRDEEAALHRG